MFNCFASKTITHHQQIWYVCNQNLKINDKFSITSEIQERHFIIPIKQSQFIVRSTFKKLIKNNWDFGVGFAFLLYNTEPTVAYNLESSELRPHIEFNNKQAYKHVTISHRYKLETRILHNVNGKELAEGFKFNNMRFHYQIGLDFLLNKPKNDKNAVKLKVAEEIMLNLGKNIKYNLFDQNRLSVTLQYAPIKAVAIDVGYVNWFQQRSSGDKYFDSNIFRLGIVNNINIVKKEKIAK